MPFLNSLLALYADNANMKGSVTVDSKTGKDCNRTIFEPELNAGEP